MEQREWNEQRRRWAEERRREERQRLERKRLEDLKESGALLHKASEIRALAERVGAAVQEGSVAATPEQLARWQAWARAQADRLDPVVSGQVLSHLVVPALDDEAASGIESEFT